MGKALGVAAEYAAARLALDRVAMIELSADAPELPDLARALEALDDVLEGWYARLAASGQAAEPQPVRQIGASLLARRFAAAETIPTIAR